MSDELPEDPGERAVVPQGAPRIPHWTDRLAYKYTQKTRTAIQSELNIAFAMTHCPSLQGLVAWDEIKQAVVFLRRPPWDNGTGNFVTRRMTDSDVSVIRSLLALSIDTETHHSPGIGQLIHAKTVAAGIVVAAQERPVNEITDYLKKLRGTWDGTPRVGTLCTRFLGAEPSAINQEMFTRWMVSAYQRAMNPGVKADHILILEGGQGTGKSTFLSVLFKGYHSENFPSNLHHKDAVYALMDAWVVESSEMAGMSKAEIIDLKRYITQRDDRCRLSYGQFQEVLPRRIVFAATTNEKQYFNDDTGERRFWPIECAQQFYYRIEDLEAVRDQVWAEVVHLAETGKRWWFDRADPVDIELLTSLGTIHLAKKVEDALTPYIERILVRESWPASFQITAMMNWLEIKPEEAQRHAKRVGSALRKLGYDRRFTKNSTNTSAREWYRLDPNEPAEHDVAGEDTL